MKSVLVGFYSIPGHGLDSVETPLIGNPPAEKQALDKLIKTRYPKVDFKTIVRTGVTMERRDAEDLGPVELTPGMTLVQLFSEGESGERRKVGRTFFSGAPYDIVANLHRAQGAVTFTLKALLKNDMDIRLPNKFSPQQEAANLPQFIKEILGDGARDTQLNVKDAVLKPQV